MTIKFINIIHCNICMKKIWVGLFLIFILVFSGCASLGGLTGKSKTPTVDRTGDGLKVTFVVKEDKISVRELRYELTMKNTGIEPVILKKENFKLVTNQDGVVLDQASVDNFYTSVFRGSDTLTIYHDQEITGFTGPIFIDKDFFEKKTRESFDLVLKIKYDYNTSFSNNLQIDLMSASGLKVLDSVSQAAPVQVNKIELSPISTSEYVLNYYIVDKGQTSSEERRVNLKDVKITFRTAELSGCKGLVYKDSVYKDVGLSSLVISSDTPEVIVACKVDVSDIEKNSKMTTTTFGSFNYEYKIDVKKTVTLPKKSGEQIVWQ